jgi:transposase
VGTDRAAHPAAGILWTDGRETSMREVVNAIFYIAQTGCQLAPAAQKSPAIHTTVQRYFYAWRDSSVWQTINHVLLM